MPAMFVSQCNKCGFKTSMSSGGYMYALDENGNKVICPHPGEASVMSKVLEIPREEATIFILGKYEKLSKETKEKIRARLGRNFQHICLDCLAEVFLDKKRDEIKCDKCGSTNLKYVADLTGQSCPKCKEGTIEKIKRGIS